MNKRLAAVASARAAVPRASGGRSHMLARLAAVVLALLVIANCKPAHADTGGAVMYSTDDGGSYNAVVRDVTNRYDAALVCLGYSRSAVTDAQMETKLSNEGTGGRFWEFAQTFFTDVAADNIPGWSPTWLYGSILANGWVYGDNFAKSLWWTETTSVLRDGALQDLRTVLGGGSLGGGNGGIGDAIELVPRFYNATPTGIVSDGVLYTNKLDSSVLTNGSSWKDNYAPASGLILSVNSSMFDNLTIDLDDYDLLASVRASNKLTTATQAVFVEFYLLPKDGYTVTMASYTDTNGYLGAAGGTYEYYENVYVTKRYYSTGTNTLYPTISGKVIGGYSLSNQLTPINTSGKYIGFGSMDWVGVAGSSGGGGGTNNWPDPEPTPVPDPDPTEPVVPEPDPTPVPDPGPIDDPVLPDPDPIDNPSTGGGTTIVYAPPTDTTLIENWLSVIYDAITQGFNAVTDDMATHCQHIQTKLTNLYEVMMSTLGKYLTNQTSSINNNLSNQTWWLARQIGNQFEGLQDYMHELAVWLAEQLDFSITDTGYGYDDTSVVAWLKKIYAKLGTGGGTSKPTDPVEEPDNWWDWLLRALQNWVDGLGDVVGDLLGNLNDLLGGLLDKFPFGIPWMTLEVITLLAADPVTPVFTIDYSVYSVPIRYEVDLSPYDTAAATIRAMFYIVFGGFLLLKTPKVISEMMGVFE